MNKVIDRSIQPISLQPIFDANGILMTVHGDHPTENMVVTLIPEGSTNTGLWVTC